MQNIKAYESMTKLALTDCERVILSERMGALMESFRKLQDIDTGSAEPLVTVLDIQNVLREDVAEKVFTREEILRNAPEQYDGYFQVPRTLD